MVAPRPSRKLSKLWNAGADIVKLFPGEALGPSFVKAVKGPLPQAPLMPTGGVSIDNVAQWIKQVVWQWVQAAV